MTNDDLDLVALLERAVSGTSTVTFVERRGVETTCTVKDLWDDAVIAGVSLHSMTDDSSVGIVLEPTRESVACLFGAWIVGLRVVSIPPPAHQSMAGRIPGIASIEALDLIVAPAEEHDSLNTAAVQLCTPHEVISTRFARVGKSRRAAPALVQYTSGSIGDPAGVELTTRAIAANVTAVLEVVNPRHGERVVSWLPLDHDMGLIGMLVASIIGIGPEYANGGSLTLLHPEKFMRDPRSWLRTCSERSATITAAPASAYEIATMLRPTRVDLSELRMAMIGAEPVHAHVVDNFVETFREYGLAPSALCPAYGLAETAVAVSIASPDEEIRRSSPSGVDSLTTSSDTVSSGRPLSNTSVRIADEQDGVGLVQVRSPSLLSRYTGGRARDVDIDGYLNTCDMGFLQHGELHIVGRADDVILVGGRKLYPMDIEATVSKALSIPTQAVGARPVVDGYELVLERRGRVKRLSEKDVRRLIARAVATIGVKPSRVTVTEPGRLPRTPNGKLRRSRIE